MSESGRKTAVRVVIAGEEYTLRADAAPDYTRECAAYVDRTIEAILRESSLVEAQKAVILAALSLTDQLFQARREIQRLREDLARRAARLAAEVEAAMAEEAPARPQ